MREVRLGILTLGYDPVEVTAPLAGSDQTALRVELNILPDSAADLVERCIDYLIPFPDTEILLAPARELKQSLGSLPLLIAFRSLPEGGRPLLDAAAYWEFRLWFTKEQLLDLLDVEFFSGFLGPVAHIATLQRERIPVITSRYFFDGMSVPQVIRETFQRMQDCNADILKLAVMTETIEDLLSFLQLSAVQRQAAGRPSVLIGMGPYGVLSRISYAEFGFYLSFGALWESSAPGQLPAQDLRRILSPLPEYSVSQTAEPRK